MIRFSRRERLAQETCGVIVSTRDKGRAREAILMDLLAGQIDILVGTHAIFQESVAYRNLGLVVIDEQHRFGVHQRLALRMKGTGAGKDAQPHQLMMSATPIPRTLAMSYYADLDVSVIDEVPPTATTIRK